MRDFGIEFPLKFLVLSFKLFDRGLCICYPQIEILFQISLARPRSPVIPRGHTYLQASISGGDLRLQLLDPTFQFVFVAELISTFTPLQFQPMKIRLVRS